MKTKFKIGIDYGGTKIEGILIDEVGNEIHRKRMTYNKDYQTGIDTIHTLVKEFEHLAKSQCSVGIGIPGSSSHETGLVKNANSIWLNQKPFKADLEKILNREVRLMNDANCFTLSESIDGAGEKYKSAAQGLIALATYGIGMLIGFRLAGKITDQFAIESGHDWTQIWTYPAIFAAVVLVVFILAFKNEKIEIEK